MIRMDKRWGELAEILIRYSTEVKPGERVMIAMSEAETFPLCQAVYEEAVRAGAYPQVQFLSETLRHALMNYGSGEQIAWFPEIEAYGMEWADVYIGLRGGYDLDIHSDIPVEVLAANQAAMGKVSALRWEKTRWVLVRVPNEAFARQTGSSLNKVMDMFFDACLIDWNKQAAVLKDLTRKLEKGTQVRIEAEGTDLSFSVKGRRWLAGDGTMNMPDGEISTAPVESTLDGFITFDFPGVLSGRLMYGIRLEWKEGKLTEARSDTNQDFLRRIVRTDPGAGLLGEFAFGMNPAIDLFCKDILFDEKIGGTIHVAMGRAYPECGGTNRSAIHLDIVKDTRKEGAVYLDGRKIFEKGLFLI